MQDLAADLGSIPGAVVLSTSISCGYTRGRTEGISISGNECQRVKDKLVLRNGTGEVVM